MALKGYNSYRGRQGIWRRLLAIVLVLVLMAACAFLLLQRYITYSDDGSFYLDLPFEFDLQLPSLLGGEKNDGEQPSDNSGQDMNLVVDPPQENEEEPDSGEDTTEEQTPPQEDVPQQELYVAPRLIELPQLPQDEAALSEMLAATGANGFVFYAKKDLGEVSYSSAVALPGAVAQDAVAREVLERLCAQKNVYTVARINCFHDSIYAFKNMEAAAICQSNGYVWYDYNLQHWLDPEKDAARQYLINLALECAQLGFDELLLEDVCYPTGGRLYKIDYSKNTMEKTAALCLFLDELKMALEPYGVRLSLLLDEETVRGIADDVADSGFDAREILRMVDAVYVATENADETREEMAALLENEGVPTLIPIVSEAPAEGGWYQIG